MLTQPFQPALTTSKTMNSCDLSHYYQDKTLRGQNSPNTNKCTQKNSQIYLGIYM